MPLPLARDSCTSGRIRVVTSTFACTYKPATNYLSSVNNKPQASKVRKLQIYLLSTTKMTWSETVESLVFGASIMINSSAPIFGFALLLGMLSARSDNRSNKHHERMAELRQWSLNESRIRKMSDDELEGVVADATREIKWRQEARLRTPLVNLET